MKLKKEYDDQIRIILLGDNCVGKSCLLQSYFGSIDLYYYTDTAGVDLKTKMLRTQNKTIRLRLWDASGNPKLQNLISTYFNLSDGAFICFDLTTQDSFQHTKTHIKQFRAIKEEAPMFLIGCKSDLVRKRVVSSDEAKELADSFGIPYFEVSALNKMNVKETFEQSAEQIYFSIQRDKIKPLLVEIFFDYLKLDPQKNRSGFFSALSQNLNKEGPLKNEHDNNLEQLFNATAPRALDEFCVKTLALLEKVDFLFKETNPGWSSISKSPLSKALQQTLNIICDIPQETDDLPYLKKLILQQKVMQTQFKVGST
jgi:Ras-related protein Rab-1A